MAGGSKGLPREDVSAASGVRVAGGKAVASELWLLFSSSCRLPCVAPSTAGPQPIRPRPGSLAQSRALWGGFSLSRWTS